MSEIQGEYSTAKPYHRNPRQITKKELAKLDADLLRFGDLGGIILNVRTNEIIGGNQRTHVFKAAKASVRIEQRHEQPTPQGEIARGKIVWRGVEFDYREVDWDEPTAAAANIRANISAGKWDWDVFANSWDFSELSEWMDGDLLKDWKRDTAALDNFLKSEGEEVDENYSRKIEAPIYTPKGPKPEIKSMYDTKRTDELLAEIEAADLPEDEKEFLRIAARRHTVLNFKRIAEYYAHSPAPVQRLMENSALVIIDFNRAIELGYVKLSEEIAAQYKKDYGTS